MSKHRTGDDAGVRVPRRLILQAFAAGSALLDAGCGEASFESNPATRSHAISRPHEVESLIQIENRLPGSSRYALSKPALTNEVEGYASATSVEASDVLNIFVNVDGAQGVRAEVYRIGHYQGLGARHVSTLERVLVAPQTAPIADAKTGLLECQWQIAFALLIEPSWLTGYYLCKLINDAGFESYVPFIVREVDRVAPLLVQASVTTWQAYNTWGGVSLYVNELPTGANFTEVRAFQVSFDRPYDASADIGSVEYALVRFLEQHGYDVSYVTNIDLDRTPEVLRGRALFATSGHDEYWSLTERNAVRSARDAGLCMAFFSGNTAYRRIRLESSSAGDERRTITCYKDPSLDPHGHTPDTTADAGHAPYAQPENEILGVLWAGWSHLTGFPFLVSAPDHWIYEGTGVRANETLGHIIGSEWDVVSNNAVSPAGLEVVGDSVALHEYGYVARATATVYYPTATSFVFAAGTICWADGLGTPGFIDWRLQRVTKNILSRAGVLSNSTIAASTAQSAESGTSERTLVLAGSGVPGMLDGAALSAQFNQPGGLAAGPAGELYVADTGNDLIRKISPDGQVSTLFGGQGAVRLRTPTGIAVGPDGTVYVSDTNNYRIVAVLASGDVITYGTGSSGYLDHANPQKAEFNRPRGLAVDGSGALYVADFRNNAIRRIDDSGVTTVAGDLGGPTAVAIGDDGRMYYLATWWGSVVRLEPDGTLTLLANPSMVQGDQSGVGADAALRPADGLCVTANGLVFSDTGNNRMRGMAFDEQSTVSTLLGNGEAGAGSGAGAATQVVLPRGLTAFNGGYAVADSANHRILWFSA